MVNGWVVGDIGSKSGLDQRIPAHTSTHTHTHRHTQTYIRTYTHNHTCYTTERTVHKYKDLARKRFMSTDRIVQNADCFAPGEGEGGGRRGREKSEGTHLFGFFLYRQNSPNRHTERIIPQRDMKTAGESSAPLSGCTSITTITTHHHPTKQALPQNETKAGMKKVKSKQIRGRGMLLLPTPTTYPYTLPNYTQTQAR